MMQDMIEAGRLPDPAPALESPVAPNGTPSTRPLGYELRHGGRAPMVQIVQDDTYPDMWRMHWPDGQVSDMTNLACAKDAAAGICERMSSGKDRRRFTWKTTPVAIPSPLREQNMNDSKGA